MKKVKKENLKNSMLTPEDIKFAQEAEYPELTMAELADRASDMIKPLCDEYILCVIQNNISSIAGKMSGNELAVFILQALSQITDTPEQAIELLLELIQKLKSDLIIRNKLYER